MSALASLADKEFLRTHEAARVLNLSGRTLEKYRVTGGGPLYRKLGGRVVYRLEDLRAWADRGQLRSTSEPGGIPTPAAAAAAKAERA